MTLNGRSLARGTAAPNEEVVIHAAPPERGWIAGTVELEPDELPGDNVRYFAVWIGPPPGIALSSGAGTFVRNAVDVLKASGRVTDGHDIAINAGDEVSSLPALIVAPSDQVRIGAANRALERAGIPWRFGLARHGEAAVSASTVRAPTAGLPASSIRPDSGRQGVFTDVSVSLRYDLLAQRGADADTLARVGRDAWIVSGPRYVIVASPLDPSTTNFPVRAAFVPWLADLLTERLVGEPGGVVDASPGSVVTRPRWADALESANGVRVVLADDLQVPGQTGAYFLDRGGRRVGAVVVNADPRESMLDRLPPADLAHRIQARQVLVPQNQSEFSSMSFRSAGRRSVAQPLLGAGLALLVLEALVVGVGRRVGG
jgi:hypothetical protein